MIIRLIDGLIDLEVLWSTNPEAWIAYLFAILYCEKKKSKL